LSSRSTEREEEAGHSCKGICRIFWRSNEQIPRYKSTCPCCVLEFASFVLWFGALGIPEMPPLRGARKTGH